MELDINDTFRATDDFIEMVAYVAQMVPSFSNAQDLLSRLRGIDISVSQIQKIAEHVGRKVHEDQMAKAKYAYARPEVAAPLALVKDLDDCILYIMMDGSAVNTRIQDEDGSTWKEMKLGMVFTDKDIRKQNKHVYIDKKEYAAYFGSVDEFKKLVFEAAARAGYGKIKRVVVIGDGAKWIWNMCEELFPDAVCVLDLFHMKENIYDYAKALFPDSEKKYTQWAKTVSYYMETDQTEKALKKIKNSPLPATASKSTVNLERYITNNIDRINYLAYKNRGYYVGSGMIESGNKLVVQKRLKQAGMRWSKDGAQYIVALRAKYESNRWEDVHALVAPERKAA
jgi:transposase-like protein